MKLTKKIEAEALKVCRRFWDSYLGGDVIALGSCLTNDYKLIGSTEAEVFRNKKAAMKYLKAAIRPVAGVLITKNMDTTVAAIEGAVVVDSIFEVYAGPHGPSGLYGKYRLTSILKKERGKWLISHQHGSLPHLKAGSGESIASAKIQKENRDLRDAVRRQTKELEDKNRELEIEASLARVRARAMAMQASSELADLIGIIHGEIARLDENLDRSYIILFEDDGSSRWWMSDNKNLSLRRGYYLPFHKYPPYRAALDGWRKRKPVWTYVLKGAIKKKWDNFIFNETELAQLPKMIKSHMAGAKVAHWSSSYNKYGCISTGSIAPLGKSSFELMVRFSQMFEQTYTRFLDLQKAEAQAREAQIEAALEKVRSASMGMHHSDELEKVVTVLFDRLSELGLSFDGALIYNFDKKNRSLQLWVASKLLPTPVKFNLPYDDRIAKNPIMKDLWQAIESHEYVLNKTYQGKTKNDYFRYVARNNEHNLPNDVRDLQLRSKSYTISFAAEKNSIVGFDSWTGQLTSDEDFQVIRRLAGVFEQAYTRFLDLKNAEALARESQVQLALERVRARTMAMQKSDELKEVAMILFKQVADLGIRCWTTGFNVWSEDGNSYQDYVTNPMGVIMEPYTVDATQFAIVREVSAARKKGEKFYVDFSTGERQQEAYKHLQEFGNKDQYEKILESGFQFPSQQVNHFVFGEKVSLLFITYDPVPEAHDIFKRFGKAFEQTYTRFLDLQKAEAQARESQIQLALERVRARTMAMQKSDELNDVAILLFQQVTQLGIKTWTTGFNVWSEDNNSYVDYITSPAGNSIEAYKIDATKFSVFIEVANARKSGDEFWVQYLEGDILKETYRQLTKFGGQDQYDKMLADGFQFPSRQYDHFVFGSKVSLMFITYDPVPESHDIFKRFGRVFEQTYTRFLDLKKAEAQAREATIEAALEKIRSRSMGMQQSSELKDVVAIVFEKLKDLGLVFDGLGIQLFTEGSKSSVIWVAAPGQISEPALIQLPFYEHEFGNSLYIKDIWSAKEAGVDIINKTYSFDEKNKFFSYVSRYNELPLSATEFHRRAPSYTATVAMERNSALVVDNWSGKAVSTEEFSLIKRLSKVFEQAYTRFLDLQKAEAQAREAQIEAALEKVRSTSLAMHHSHELEKVVTVLFDRLLDIGLNIDSASINIFDKTRRSGESWVAAKMLTGPIRVNLPFDDEILENPFIRDLWRSLETGEHVFNMTYSGKAKDEYFLFEARHNKIPEQVTKFQLEAAKWTVTWATGQNSIIIADSWYDRCSTEEDFRVLKRFSKVFEEAYTRFLDLQKAEAAAREAQIEAAMEKIRSRSLAMHHSDELKDVVRIMFNKLDELNVQHGTVAIQIFDFNTKDSIFWPGNKLSDEPPKILLPFDEYMMNADTCHRDLWQAMTKGEIIFNKVYPKEKKDRWFNYVFAHNDFDAITGKDRDYILNSETQTVCFIPGKRSALFADSFDGTLYSEADLDVLKRASRVFEQAYTRFLDLQKAEAAAREAQIEAALERVRSRTMAMHKSEELLEVITVVCEQLQHIGIKFSSVSFGKNSTSFDMDFWAAVPDLKTPIRLYAPYANISIYQRLQKAHEEHKNFFTDTFTAEETKVWYEHLIGHNPSMFNEKSRSYLISRPAMTRTTVLLKNVFLFAINHAIVNYSNEENEILIRFANVFEQAYTRFLDLQKAEAQARESQIETALERVRAKAMSMHTAQQLKDVVHELRHQLGLLELRELETCVIQLNEESPDFIHAWAAVPHADNIGEIQEFFTEVPKRGLKIYEEVLSAYSSGKQDYMLINEGEKLREWIAWLRQQQPEAYTILSDSDKIPLDEMRSFWSLADFQGGSLLMVTFAEPGETSRSLLRRFANVFGLAYRRFADLKQAEEQARESQIEAALERVRARAMAMHTAQELKDVIREVRIQMGALGQPDLNTCVIHLHDESPDFIQAWAALPIGNNEIRTLSTLVPKKGLAIIEESLKAYFDNRQDYVMVNDGEKFAQWNEFVRQSVPLAHESMSESMESLAEQKQGSSFWSYADFEGGSLLMVTIAMPEETSRALLRRFSNVFGLAYRRFADLKRAEAQAREANIETALEKIRSRSLGMHKSDEIKDVVAILFEKLKELGVVFDGGAAIHLFREGTKDTSLCVAAPELDGAIICDLPYNEEEFNNNPVIHDIWTAQETGKSLLNKGYSFEEKNRYFNYIFNNNDVAIIPERARQAPLDAKNYTVTLIAEKNSLLGANSWTGQEFSETDVDVLKRVARVFEQAYIRFLDLQKAEIHAKEAVCQASLDRVRAEIASMRTVDDLDRITPLIWRELNTIGIPFIRCGVFIMDEPNRVVQSFLSTPDGKAIAVFQLPFDIPVFVSSIVKHWRDKKVYLDYWDEAAKKEFAETLVNQGIFSSSQQYLDILPKEPFHLHFLPFAQGMLYAGNLTQFGSEELVLLQSLADAFATAYARYDDFKKLEAAKEQVDRTLVDLRQAQQQLVQSEKMASLGELTAGIAHEIQNPLNFVNNFSEVSNELLDEMKTELQAGNLKEASQLAESIKQNLEKITHHGKRADGIVKGMLQHSRVGSGQKEPTDLNFLCDEYLRLAYHGYRAKEKSFNARFESKFDSTLPKIDVVAQDIGRVILNLINNAFFAVGEMRKLRGDGYQPTVSVVTRNLSGKVEISVTDNGVGISEKVKEKIFQPFFTTKPTGQGTGLGLSLSYDIIKAHGGTLDVISQEGVGSEFIIRLPFP